jgi:hypothetical protein
MTARFAVTASQEQDLRGSWQNPEEALIPEGLHLSKWTRLWKKKFP